MKLHVEPAVQKSARVVGEVLGKYHPHGDSAVYDALVRMAQDFSMRYPLVDGQGNFGSVDGDPPAAMRYTESRMSRLASELLADIDKETVDFGPNFDDSPSASRWSCRRAFRTCSSTAPRGIAVGMATNVPPHNLREVDRRDDALDRQSADHDRRADARRCRRTAASGVKGPDFPTAGFIYGTAGIRQAFHTGRGRIVMRARDDDRAHPRQERPRADRRHRDPVPGEQGRAASRRSRSSCARSASRASATCATRATATACAS